MDAQNQPAYVLQTFPQDEEKAIAWLRNRLGIDAYCPMCTKFIKPRKTRGPAKEVQRPVFRGYLFITANIYTQWYYISSCPYIYGYLSNMDAPVAVPNKTMETLKNRVSSGFYDDKDAGTPADYQYSVDECVLITPGDVTMLATVVGIKGKNLLVSPVAVGAGRTITVKTCDVLPAQIIVHSQNTV